MLDILTVDILLKARSPDQ